MAKKTTKKTVSSDSEPSKEKSKTTTSVVDEIRKKYGAGALMDMSRDAEPVEVIPTGSIALDKATGIGGWPRGRICELFGPESGGKTTLCSHAIAEAQAMGIRAGYVDAEHAMDLRYAAAIGVNVAKLGFSQPDSGEQALGIVQLMASSGEFGIVVVDSVAALTPQAELDGDMGDTHVGLQARMMGQAMRKLVAIASRSNCLILFVNQLRMKVGVIYGSPEVTPGGNALKFYASMRLEVRRAGVVKAAELATGCKTRVKVVKNKLAPPFREAEFDIEFGVGIDKAAELIDLATAAEVLSLSGSHYSFDGTKVANGRANMKRALSLDPALADRIRQALVESQSV